MWHHRATAFPGYILKLHFSLKELLGLKTLHPVSAGPCTGQLCFLDITMGIRVSNSNTFKNHFLSYFSIRDLHAHSRSVLGLPRCDLVLSRLPPNSHHRISLASASGDA